MASRTSKPIPRKRETTCVYGSATRMTKSSFKMNGSASLLPFPIFLQVVGLLAELPSYKSSLTCTHDVRSFIYMHMYPRIRYRPNNSTRRNPLPLAGHGAGCAEALKAPVTYLTRTRAQNQLPSAVRAGLRSWAWS